MTNKELNPELVNAQLARILMAEPFQNSGTLSRFLKFIVEETLAGHESELKEYIIALKVLSKRTDFNPQSDPIVRIHAGRLRRALNEYFLEAGKDDQLIISIPKGAYVPTFSIRQENITSGPAVSKPSVVPRNKITVAVLPFNNISTDINTVAFADGLGDHISTELTRYSELSVISYYSCRKIVERLSDIKEAGLLLDAKYILTGSVQSDNNRLRIRVQLILTETREQIWVNSYDRQSTTADLFEVQDEIVWQVVSQTAGHYGAISRSISRIPAQQHISDAGVYDTLFWYYNYVGNLTEEMFLKAEDAMFKAVQTDPGYALGWAVLGEIFVGGYFMGYRSQHTENQLEQAIVYGKKAIRIDPTCQHAYQTIALANIFLHNKSESLKTIEEWTKVKPGAAGIMGAMGFILICCGEYEKGYKMLDESVQLNPYYQWWFNAGFAFYFFNKEDYENAIYWAEKMNMPEVAWELLLKTASYVEMNNMKEARKSCIELLERFPFLRGILEDYVGAFLQDKSLVDKFYNALLKSGVKEL